MKPRCDGCRFYEAATGPAVSGVCRRRPPSVAQDIGDGDAVMSLWPEVLKQDWCGEHAPLVDPIELEKGGVLTPDPWAIRVRDRDGVEHVLTSGEGGSIHVPFRCTFLGFAP